MIPNLNIFSSELPRKLLPHSYMKFTEFRKRKSISLYSNVFGIIISFTKNKKIKNNLEFIIHDCSKRKISWEKKIRSDVSI